MQKVRKALVLISFGTGLLMAAVSCRRGPSLDSSLFTIEIIDGVKHVHNQAPQRRGTSNPTLEYVGKIGELAGEEEKDILYDPADAALLPNGDILVLERRACAIKRYDKEHQFISSFGQKGQGPGDFSSPFLIRLNRDKSEIYIADSRISVFSLDGRYQRGFKPERIARFGSIGAEFRTSGMAVLSGREVVLPSDPSLWLDSGQQRLLSVYDEAGTIVRSFGAFEAYDRPELTFIANIVGFTNDAQNNIYVAYAHQNRIIKFASGGTILFSSDRFLPYEPKNSMKVELFKSGDIEREFQWPSVSSVTKGIHLDGKDRIWVLTYLKQPNRFASFDEEEDLSGCYEFDVFDSLSGVLLFKVPFPNIPFDTWSLYGDRVYLIDSRRESCVYEYRIVERK